MILCFALGIANIFTLYVFLIIFSIIALYVFPSAALPATRDDAFAMHHPNPLPPMPHPETSC